MEDGLSADEVPTTSDIEEAARLANAHDFIMGLPHGYETVSSAFYFALQLLCLPLSSIATLQTISSGIVKYGGHTGFAFACWHWT